MSELTLVTVYEGLTERQNTLISLVQSQPLLSCFPPNTCVHSSGCTCLNPMNFSVLHGWARLAPLGGNLSGHHCVLQCNV